MKWSVRNVWNDIKSKFSCWSWPEDHQEGFGRLCIIIKMSTRLKIIRMQNSRAVWLGPCCKRFRRSGCNVIWILVSRKPRVTRLRNPWWHAMRVHLLFPYSCYDVGWCRYASKWAAVAWLWQQLCLQSKLIHWARQAIGPQSHVGNCRKFSNMSHLEVC